MAQTLKDDVREKIIESAKEEFLKYGYEDSSMRRIASNSDMTVGNLYRYFQNKEALNVEIVGPTYTLINNLVKKLTGNRIDFASENWANSLKKDELQDMFSQLGNELVNIYLKHKIEFNILMMHSKLNDEMIDWFTSMINQYIVSNYPVENLQQEVSILSKSFAVSIFDGLKVCFRSNSNEQQLRTVVNTYFKACIHILDLEISL